MNINLSRLRKSAAEEGDIGTAAQRDELLNTFLDELALVVSDLVSEAISDLHLRALYAQWVVVVNQSTTQASRTEWLAAGVTVYPFAYEETQGDTPSNVVSIARR